MLRLGSLLMVFLLTVPMVRDCCLPVTHLLPCHGSKHSDDVTCFANQQAIAETKTAIGVSSPTDFACSLSDDAKSAIFTQLRRTSARVRLVRTPTTDIYLRTGALLI